MEPTCIVLEMQSFKLTADLQRKEQKTVTGFLLQSLAEHSFEFSIHFTLGSPLLYTRMGNSACYVQCKN